MLDRDEIDADALAGEVTTVFGNQRLFTDSVRDFYAYLAGILSRYDLGGEEYAQFKELLLVYIDLITADVNRHAPAVAHRIGLVLKLIDPLLATLAQLPGLTLPDGTPVERAQGRTRADWEELASWYDAARRVGPGAAPRGRGAGARPADHQRQAPARLLRHGLLPAGRLPPAGPLVRRGGRRGRAPAVRGGVRRLSVAAPAVRPGGTRSAHRAHDVVVGFRSGARPGVAAGTWRPRDARAQFAGSRPDRRPAPADRRGAARGRAAPGGRRRAGADRLAARGAHLPGRAEPAAGPGGRAAGPAPRGDRRPRRRPAAARGPRPGHGRHQPGRDDDVRRPQPRGVGHRRSGRRASEAAGREIAL